MKVIVKPENVTDNESETTNSKNTEFTVSKNLLCKVSPVFDRMLNGNFKEAQEQSIVLEEMKDVVSTAGVGNFISWLYRGVVQIDHSTPSDKISAAIELARFEDMYQIARLERAVESFARATIKWYASYSSYSENVKEVNRNTRFMTADHVKSGLKLPKNHAVRRLLAQVSVAGFIQSEAYMFANLTVSHPAYASDLLREVQKVLHDMTDNAVIRDPILQDDIPVRRVPMTRAMIEFRSKVRMRERFRREWY